MALEKDAKHGLETAQQGLVQQLRAALGDEVHQKLLKGGEEGLTDTTCRRWLVARKWVLDDAVRDLGVHANWRVQYVPAGAIDKASIAEELAQNKAFLQGLDNNGRPLAVVMVKRHLPQKDGESCKRLIVYSLDAAVRMGQLNPQWDGKVVGILDLSSMSMKNYDVTALRAIFDTLQNHYPERLHKLYLYCAPYVFYGVWKLVSPFVDPVTRDKVQFVFRDAATAAIFARDFPPKVLPPRYTGGTGEFQTVPQALALMAAAGGSGAACVAGHPAYPHHQHHHPPHTVTPLTSDLNGSSVAMLATANAPAAVAEARVAA